MKFTNIQKPEKANFEYINQFENESKGLFHSRNDFYPLYELSPEIRGLLWTHLEVRILV